MQFTVKNVLYFKPSLTGEIKLNQKCFLIICLAAFILLLVESTVAIRRMVDFRSCSVLPYHGEAAGEDACDREDESQVHGQLQHEGLSPCEARVVDLG